MKLKIEKIKPWLQVNQENESAITVKAFEGRFGSWVFWEIV